MMVFFDDELRPELLEPLLSPLRPAIDVDVTFAVVVTGEAELVVMTDDKVWPSLMVVRVVTTGTNVLLVSFVVKTEVTS